MILGISMSHDASAAILHEDGVVHSAIAEERLSRKKNHIGIPILSVSRLLESFPTVVISKVVIGSHESIDFELAVRMAVATHGNPSNPPQSTNQPYPGFQSHEFSRNGREIVQNILLTLLPKQNQGREIDWVWVKHHDSHLGCALGASEYANSLLFSFDGSGDGESGAIALMEPGSSDYSVIARIPEVDSLGNLYSAITKRYNFKVSQHEGKITGLAAYGDYSSAYDFLKSHISVSQGIPEIKYVKGLKSQLAINVLRKFGLSRKSVLNVDEIAQIASSRTVNYPDLAFAIQKVLEGCVTEIVDYWVTKYQIGNVSLAGGVFANVKLNQRISELNSVNSVNIFPNMGDGGISVGGVWSHLSKINLLNKGVKYRDMYLAPYADSDFDFSPSGLKVETFENFSAHAVKIAKEVSQGKIVAVHWGSMEFGPRALGNRSIILDARNREIIDRTNDRLKRTDFMPFAPVVTEKDFKKYFRTQNQTLQPFEYMTMTCEVLPDMHSIIPAVTHVDGTARPQIVRRESNPFLFEVLSRYQELTGVAVLINTSLNMHEEPINFTLEDSLRALKLGGIDVVHTREKGFYLG